MSIKVDWRRRVVHALNNSPDGIATMGKVQKLAGGSSFVLLPVLKALCDSGHVTINMDERAWNPEGARSERQLAARLMV
jgi:hypothetical protein